MDFKMFHFLKRSNLNKNDSNGTRKDFKIQTFTYFIPAPPARTSGYREKQFDKIFYEFINQGFEIIDFKTSTISGQNSSGMWIIFLVRPTTETANVLNLDFDIKPQPENDAVEGLYYIHSDSNEENV